MNIPPSWYDAPPDITEIPEGIFTIQTDAAFKGGITGTCSIIRCKGKEYAPKDHIARTKGPIHAELVSVQKGLQDIKKINKPVREIIVFNDNLFVYRFLIGEINAKKGYIVDVLSSIDDLLIEIESDVTFIRMKSKKMKRVDRRALKKRKSEEKRHSTLVSERISKIEKFIVRGRSDVEIIKNGDEYRAIAKKGGFLPGYKVTLDPPFCECPWWKHNWGDKPLQIQRARGMPCKHICALSELLGEDIYSIYQRQIERVD